MTVRVFLRKQYHPPPVDNAQQPDPSHRTVDLHTTNDTSSIAWGQVDELEDLLNDGWCVIGAEVVD